MYLQKSIHRSTREQQSRCDSNHPDLAAAASLRASSTHCPGPTSFWSHSRSSQSEHLKQYANPGRSGSSSEQDMMRVSMGHFMHLSSVQLPAVPPPDCGCAKDKATAESKIRT